MNKVVRMITGDMGGESLDVDVWHLVDPDNSQGDAAFVPANSTGSVNPTPSMRKGKGG